VAPTALSWRQRLGVKPRRARQDTEVKPALLEGLHDVASPAGEDGEWKKLDAWMCAEPGIATIAHNAHNR
jgi:hypothetical protein